MEHVIQSSLVKKLCRNVALRRTNQDWQRCCHLGGLLPSGNVVAISSGDIVAIWQHCYHKKQIPLATLLPT